MARISDPNRKQDREGALYEGREVIVKNLHWQASEAELREIFGGVGEVEKARIPRNMAGKSKGSAFITFATPEQAKSAVDKLNGRDIRGRSVLVEVAKPSVGSGKRSATSVIEGAKGRGRSGTPASTNGHGEEDVQMNGTATSPPVQASSSNEGAVAAPRKERTLYLTNIPDTVNDARVRAFLQSFGALKKIILRPDHQGAIVEFGTIADAGRAEMRIPEEAFQFAEGKVVNVVSEQDFFKTKPETREDRLDRKNASAKEKQKGASAKDQQADTNGTTAETKFLPIHRISRPGVGAGRGGGRRGGLGMKMAGVGMSGSRATNDGHGKTADVGGGATTTSQDDPASAAEEKAAKANKSNDDFRAMFMTGKKD